MKTEDVEKRPTQDLEYEPVRKMAETPEKPEKETSDKDSGAIAAVTDTAKKIQRKPLVAHLIRATERFNDRMGNQFGAAITYFSFLSMIPIMMVSFATAGFILASHPTLLQDIFNKILQSVSDPTMASTLKNTLHIAVEQRTTVGIVGFAIALYSGSELDGQPAGSDSRPVARCLGA
ncbi:UNVERIFIED_ORG: hypothetical protein QE398_000219 [Atlantibacter sp. SORGH_AS 304]|nr:hypothetical protein [Atlantibacter sp. SORGH_AS_0304]